MYNLPWLYFPIYLFHILHEILFSVPHAKGHYLFIWIFVVHLSTTCSRELIGWSCVCHAWYMSTISLNIFFSQTAGPIRTKLGNNVPWEVLFKTCTQNLIPSKTLVALVTKCNFLSNSLKIFWNCWSDFEIISQECSLGDPFQKEFTKFWSVNKHGSGEWGLFALYGHEGILKKSSSLKLLVIFWNNILGTFPWWAFLNIFCEIFIRQKTWLW